MRLEDPMDLERAWLRQRSLLVRAVAATLAVLALVGILLWLTRPGLDTGSAGVPADDPRRVWTINPALSWALQPDDARVLVGDGEDQAIADVPEPGINGRKSLDWAIVRGADPLAPSRSALRHRIRAQWPACLGLARMRCAAIVPEPGGDGIAPIRIDAPYWIVFAVKLDADLFEPGAGTDDSQSVFELGRTPAQGMTRSSQSPFALEVGSSPRPYLRAIVRSASGVGTGSAVMAERQLWKSGGSLADQWQYFVIRLRLHWDADSLAGIRIWRALGDGPLTRIVDDVQPNWTDDAPDGAWPRLGLIRRASLPAGAARTVFSKGVQVFRDSPGDMPLDENRLLAILRAI